MSAPSFAPAPSPFDTRDTPGASDASGSRRASGRADRAARTADVLSRIAQVAPGSPAHHQLLEELVVVNMGVAHAIASRYRGRGVPQEDLEQVADLALVKAARGFDPAAGHDFLSYAVPTIRGEVRRHFRDHSWSVRPPRRIQELQARIATADGELSQRLGRSPRPSEMAAELGAGIDDVVEALGAGGCFQPVSLDRPVDEDGTGIGDLLGAEDTDRAAVEARVALAPVVRRLGDRDRRVLMLRFFHGCTQQEIAEDIGVTQMQVSRVLQRILTGLRSDLEPS